MEPRIPTGQLGRQFGCGENYRERYPHPRLTGDSMMHSSLSPLTQIGLGWGIWTSDGPRRRPAGRRNDENRCEDRTAGTRMG
jgi:hypothetical protein